MRERDTMIIKTPSVKSLCNLEIGNLHEYPYFEIAILYSNGLEFSKSIVYTMCGNAKNPR